ncbi:dienelactone hydrolase family protein [Coleofasciculus sp. LEGE 07081]|uniref:dienelactone hydrolase family protein n=1 Tax=unclassified Coleofasciculus TaxID=2692782 RepID=UPI00187F8C82|nr:dienelactone hydrolase family protein [Coleofasciculus sp. LEGE 07081]MBE9147553.1 dienelactone hydrolase family protein [Coleofasciculus sp. LEGE 07092]
MKNLLPSILLTPIFALLGSAVALAEVRTEVIEYQHGDTVLEGFLAYDDEIEGKRPGVMVVHAWKGLGEYEKERAKQLAELGYVAFAADIYGKGIRPQTNEQAAAQAKIYRSNRKLLRDRANAGLQVLQQYSLTNPNQVAAIGYCFGGGTVLELARSGAPVAGVVSFHGNLDTPNPADAQNIQGRVLVLHGAADPYVPEEQVAGLKEEMNSANVDWQLVMYGNAVHSFTEPKAGNDPSTGAAYNADADKRSWAAMKRFFAEIFMEK